MLTFDVSSPRVVDQKYELLELLGLGSMGEVWRARHVGLGQTCAVKVMVRETLEAADASYTRFAREARIAAALSRKTRHIVSVTDFGTDHGGSYLVMELLEGESLEERIGRGCTPREVARFVADIAKGIGVAHREGILHRDLKPANVFLTRSEEGTPFAKILDFGIARLVASAKPLTVKGVVVGSPAYMSPEHALGETLDPRADVWALAVVAFEALSGILPFAAETTETTLERIVRVRPASIRDVFPGSTPPLEAFFARAFAPDIGDRFQSAAELSRAFADAVTPAPFATATLRRSIRSVVAMRHRERVGLVAIALVCAAMVAGAAVLVSRSSSPDAPVRLAEVDTPPVVQRPQPIAPSPSTTIAPELEPVKTAAPPPPLSRKTPPPPPQQQQSEAKPTASVDRSAIF